MECRMLLICQSSETCPDSCSYISAHGDWRVQVDPEIPDDSNWLHRRAADSNRLGRDLMLATCGRAPEDLRWMDQQTTLVWSGVVTWLVTIGRICVHSTAMRPKNLVIWIRLFDLL